MICPKTFKKEHYNINQTDILLVYRSIIQQATIERNWSDAQLVIFLKDKALNIPDAINTIFQKQQKDNTDPLELINLLCQKLQQDHDNYQLFKKGIIDGYISSELTNSVNDIKNNINELKKFPWSKSSISGVATNILTMFITIIVISYSNITETIENKAVKAIKEKINTNN